MKMKSEWNSLPTGKHFISRSTKDVSEILFIFFARKMSAPYRTFVKSFQTSLTSACLKEERSFLKNFCRCGLNDIQFQLHCSFRTT